MVWRHANGMKRAVATFENGQPQGETRAWDEKAKPSFRNPQARKVEQLSQRCPSCSSAAKNRIDRLRSPNVEQLSPAAHRQRHRIDRLSSPKVGSCPQLLIGSDIVSTA